MTLGRPRTYGYVESPSLNFSSPVPRRQRQQWQKSRLGPPVLHLPLPNRSQRPPTTLHNLRAAPRTLVFSPPCGAQRRLRVCGDLERGRGRLGVLGGRRAGGRGSDGVSGQLSVARVERTVDRQREVRRVSRIARAGERKLTCVGSADTVGIDSWHPIFGDRSGGWYHPDPTRLK